MSCLGSEVEHKPTYATQKANAIVSCRTVKMQDREMESKRTQLNLYFQLLRRSQYFLSLC